MTCRHPPASCATGVRHGPMGLSGLSFPRYNLLDITERMMIRATTLALALFALPASGAMAAEILIHDAKSQPESLAVAADGTLYAGSASSPYIYRVKKGAATADVFVDASNEGAGTFFLGQLVDDNIKTLWACQLTPVPGTTPAMRRTALRGFDLATGKEKLRWNLPGDNRSEE